MQQMADLGEETGHVCVICREGYKFQPTKVLGIYTFTKRCNVEEFEVKPRKTVGYSTVTHFNVVHVECHMAAVRLVQPSFLKCNNQSLNILKFFYIVPRKYNYTIMC